MTLSRNFCYSSMTVIFLAATLSACGSTSEVQNNSAAAATSGTTVDVMAAGETAAVGTTNADAADDPAIWRNAADPAASLIVGTDKKAGLHVYSLDGADKFFIDAGRVNNVDLRDNIRIGDTPGILVAASDRGDEANAMLALFRLDPATAKLIPLGKVPAGKGEAYGVCLYRDGQDLSAFMVTKEGSINQVALDLSGAKPTGKIVRELKVQTQSEGCVVDERSARLYVGEEDVGIWRFSASVNQPTTATAVAKADGKQLVADVEGLTIAPEGANGGYLIASSQGDNAYSVYKLSDDSYVGRFRIVKGKFGSTEETDGIDFAPGSFGPGYPDGMFVAQDGENQPSAQNFKMVSWADVKKAMGLQ